MILSDGEIRQACYQPEGKGIHKVPTRAGLVYPYIEENLQPASIDVRLGDNFKVFERDSTPYIDLEDPADITKDVQVPWDGYFLLHPGEFILGHTIEEVNIPDNMVARIEGKSSVGRLGLFVHVTAGFIDPGFHGSITLEMACLHPLPIMLRPGKLIAQLSFHWMSSPAEKPYEGRYQGDGSVASSRYGKPLGNGSGLGD